MNEQFLCMCFYHDGRAVTVKSQEELDAVEPGWAGSPVGPWPDDGTSAPPWDDGKGPFAPYTDWRQYAPVPMGWTIDGRPVLGLGGPPRPPGIPGYAAHPGPDRL